MFGVLSERGKKIESVSWTFLKTLKDLLRNDCLLPLRNDCLLPYLVPLFLIVLQKERSVSRTFFTKKKEDY
jgi:hypothetical protein